MIKITFETFSFILFILINLFIIIKLFLDKENYLQKNGYLIENNIISDVECEEINKIIEKELQNPDRKEGNIRNKENRKDLLLPQNKTIKSLIDKISKRYNNIFKKYFGKKYELVECSSFISYPGCKAQDWHKDVSCDRKSTRAKLITIAITLDDINDNMGPLEVYPKSHKILNSEFNKVNELDQKEVENFLLKNKYISKKLSCPKGSIIIWDSKIIHRGGTNKSSKIRPMFYFSLLESNKEKPDGPVYSIL